jgi:hypothetical protein
LISQDFSIKMGRVKIGDVWKARERAAQILAKAGIAARPREKETLEIAD